MKEMKTEKLVELIPGEIFSKEEIRSEISLRLYSSENEEELQLLWKRFKEL